MPRYRLELSPGQEETLLRHCADARYVWNLCVEQESWWHNRRWGAVKIPKAGWVRFRWSRVVPENAKSFRVTRDRAGRWHVAFTAIPVPIDGPGTGEVVGIDRGIAVSAALSTGEMLGVPGLAATETVRLLCL